MQPTESGTIDASLTEIDNLTDLDFFDPGALEDNPDNDNNQDAVETKDQVEPDPEETEDDQDQPELEATEESDEEEADEESDESEDDQPEVEPDDGILITLKDEQLPLSEIKAGYMKDQDYRNKTNEIAKYRENLVAEQTRIANITNGLSQAIAQMIPIEPDLAMSQTDPQGYYQAKMQHDAVKNAFTAIIEQANAVQESAEKVEIDRSAYETALRDTDLQILYPQLTNEVGKRKFMDGVRRAANYAGFKDEEVDATADPRIFKLAELARKGLDAEAAARRAKKKSRPVQKARPAKGRSSNTAQAAARGSNQEAMARLSKSGSFEDALRVNFAD